MSSHVDFSKQAPGATGVSPDHPAAAHLTILDAEAGLVDLFATRKKFAICGFASSSRHRIPVDDPTWIVGGMNQLYRHIPRADYWFDIHSNWREDNVEGTDHPRWLAECGIPVYMVDRPAGLPTAVTYPVDRLIAKFGVDYFTSTVAYMIALAIDGIDRAVEARLSEMSATVPTNGHAPMSVLEAANIAKALYGEYTIGIFGIDLVVGDEYDFQKACAEFWIGTASSRGILVTIAPESALCKQRWRYGYQAQPDAGLLTMTEKKARIKDIQKRADEVIAKRDQLTAELQTLDGSMQQCQYDVQVMELRSRGAAIPYTPSAARSS